MTIDECREYLPDGWTELIQQDPVLKEIFDEHEYDLENEAVPPFLIQELRGGDMERLRPILALYGQPGLDMLQGLLEIDEASRDTAEITLADGQTAYAGYFFARPDVDQREAIAAGKRYIHAVCQVYDKIFREPSPIGDHAGIILLTGQEARDMQEKIHQAYIHGKPYLPDLQITDDMGDWFSDLPMRKGCDDLDFLHEALYHISNDYFLSYYLQWPLVENQGIENPFRPHFDLWKMGLTARFFHHDQIALIDC